MPKKNIPTPVPSPMPVPVNVLNISSYNKRKIRQLFSCEETMDDEQVMMHSLYVRLFITIEENKNISIHLRDDGTNFAGDYRYITINTNKTNLNFDLGVLLDNIWKFGYRFPFLKEIINDDEIAKKLCKAIRGGN